MGSKSIAEKVTSTKVALCSDLESAINAQETDLVHSSPGAANLL